VTAVRLPEGDAVEDLWVDDAGRVSGPIDGTEALPGRFVAAGLVDAHSHPTVNATAAGPAAASPAEVRERLSGWGRGGVAVVRDVGSPGGMILDVPPGPGLPRVQAAGRFLAPEGKYFPGLLVDGVPADRLTDTALEQVRRGARWVKVIADFPPLDENGAPGAAGPEPTYSTEEIAAMVRAVHEAGARVAAHSTIDTVAALVDAGVDSIEHGPGLDDATLRRMAERGVAWTPTLGAMLAMAEGAPDDARSRFRTMVEHITSLLQTATALHVAVLAGTDAAVSLPAEIALLATHGLEPVGALRAATTTAYTFLGENVDGPGSLASLVTYDADPRNDLDVLNDPVAVVIDGVRVR
jgi:imidazolonepropionase-like amidohydrolase